MSHVHKAPMGDEERHILSFLDANEAAAAGFPLEAVVGTAPASAPLTPESLEINPLFVSYLHGTIARRAPSVDTMRSAAGKQGSGYLYVLDLRTPKDTEVPLQDILGYFEVKGGAIHEADYRQNPDWRPLTAAGPFRFPSWLTDLLRLELGAINR